MRDTLYALILVFAGMLAAGGLAMAFHDIAGIPACKYEDSVNCFWDGGENGLGESFVDVNGVVYYLP